MGQASTRPKGYCRSVRARDHRAGVGVRGCSQEGSDAGQRCVFFLAFRPVRACDYLPTACTSRSSDRSSTSKRSLCTERYVNCDGSTERSDERGGGSSKAWRSCGYRMVGCISLNFTGMRRMASARKRSRSSGSSKKPTKRPRYVVCLENKGHRGSLETRKVYRALSDAKGERAELVRIIDESGEDYLYPTRWVARVSVPAKAKKALERAGV